VVTADSMQVYRGMDIGTAKVPVAERRVPHLCIDLIEPGTPYSAACYQRDARAAIDAVLTDGGIPVVAGGTGLYVRAALDAMSFPRGAADSPAKERYERLADELGADGLHALLAERDPAAAALIHPNNVRRTVRALEMGDEGRSYADQAAGFARRESAYEHTAIGLTLDRDELYARIDRRVDAMIAAGLLDEVRGLLDAGMRDALTASQAIGYKEFVPVIEDGADLDDAVEQVKRASRRYAKRQLTWFRADPRVRWLDVTGMDPEEAAAAAIALVPYGARGDAGP
jgi:tRNA dimethylallyltransferase